MRNTSFGISKRLSPLLTRFGGGYILLVVVLAQLFAIPGAILGTLSIQQNADIPLEQLQSAGIFTGVALVVNNIFLLWVAFRLCRTAYDRLNQIKAGTPAASDDELKAWKEITSLPWRYGAIAAPTALVLTIGAPLVYQIFTFSPSSEQIVYSIFGGVVSVICVILLAVIFIDSLLGPARLKLLPSKFENQIEGIAGIKVFWRYQITTLALTIIAVLLIAPLGYDKTYTAIYKEIGSANLLNDLQTQSITISLFVILFGAILSFSISRTLSLPTQELIKVITAVENGEMGRRAEITATDEIGELSIHFNSMVTNLEKLHLNLEKQIAERTALLKATTEVGRIANSILDPEKLLAQIVNLITDRFGYYYSAVFLVDANLAWAELKEATGAAGQTLKNQKHRLQIGGKSMVGTAIASRTARIAMNAGAETYRFNNPLLPETRSEIALPLIVGDRVLGALDVQSTQDNAFGEETLETLQNMANQIAVALENANLFQETRESLEEIRAIHQQYMTDVWSDKLRTTDMQALIELPGSGRDDDEIVRKSIPLLLREQTLGSITIETDGDWDLDDQSWAEAIATQISISLENARLIEESQQSALRERLASAITEKIWSSTTIDSILQTAVREIGRALETSEATIELKLDDGKNL